MAINFTDFSKAPLQDSTASDLFENLLKGYKMGREPANMAAEEKKNALANQLQQLEAEHKPKEYALSDQAKNLANSLQSLALKHKPKEYELSDALKVAQTEKTKHPGAAGGALKPNAAVANAEYIWNLQHPGGETTPEDQAEHLQFLKKAFETGQEHVAKGTERTEVLNKTQYNRGLTQISKKHDELRDIDEGKFPGTQDKLTPDKQKEMKNDLLLSLVKDVTDPATRTKLQNGVNMNITLDSINPKKLTKFSGIEGMSDKFFDQILEGLNVGPKDYQDYVHEVIKASSAAKQMRQYLGDSIQPVAQNRLDHLSDPSAWNVSPKVAEENFRYIRDLFKRETQTLVRAVTDPSLYRSTGADGVESPPTQPPGQFDWNKYPVAGR